MKTAEELAALELAMPWSCLPDEMAGAEARAVYNAFLAGIAWRDANRFAQPVNPDLEMLCVRLIRRLKKLNVGDDVAHAAELFMRQNGLGGSILRSDDVTI